MHMWHEHFTCVSVRDSRQGLSKHEPNNFFVFIYSSRRLHHQSRRQRLHSLGSFLSCAAGGAELFRHKETRTKNGQLPAIHRIIAICISFEWLISCWSSLKKKKPSQFLLSHIFKVWTSYNLDLIYNYLCPGGSMCSQSPGSYPVMKNKLDLFFFSHTQ